MPSPPVAQTCGDKHSLSTRHLFACSLTTRSGWQPVLRSLWIGINVVELIGWEFAFMRCVLLNHSGLLSAGTGRQIWTPLLTQETRCKWALLFQKSRRFILVFLRMTSTFLKSPTFLFMGHVSKWVQRKKPYISITFLHTNLLAYRHKAFWKQFFAFYFR